MTPDGVPEEGWHGAGRRAASAAAAALPAQVSERDIRRKRPPALSFLARAATIGRGARVVSLLALDFAAVALAIFTALVLKEAAHGTVDAQNSIHGTKQFLPFAYLLTALLFARSGLYAERAQRPGLPRIVGSLFQVAVRRADLRRRQRRTLLQLLPVLELAAVRDHLRVGREGRL